MSCQPHTPPPPPPKAPPELLRIVVDTREQRPWSFALRLLAGRVALSRGTLPTGDYSVLGLEDLIAIERKSLGDFVGSITPARKGGAAPGGRERFRREIARGALLRCFVVVIEASREDVRRHRYLSGMHPNSVLGTADAWSARYCVPFIFAGSRVAAQLLAFLRLRAAVRAIFAETSPLPEGYAPDNTHTTQPTVAGRGAEDGPATAQIASKAMAYIDPTKPLPGSGDGGRFVKLGAGESCICVPLHSPLDGTPVNGVTKTWPDGRTSTAYQIKVFVPALDGKGEGELKILELSPKWMQPIVTCATESGWGAWIYKVSRTGEGQKNTSYSAPPIKPVSPELAAKIQQALTEADFPLDKDAGGGGAETGGGPLPF